MSNSESKHFLIVNEIASLLRISNSMVYKLVEEKQIPYLKRGNRLLFEKDLVMSWLRTFSVTPKGEKKNGKANG